MSEKTPLPEEPHPPTDAAVDPSAPDSPLPSGPPDDWQHLALFERVRDALYALPSFFESELNISGVLATDLFTFNSSLAATIEYQVVEALNNLRNTWDPDQEYALYRFVRQAQRFPDVILRASVPNRRTGEAEVLMGIELKGWYVLSKEAEPSFRYRATPEVCAPWDLLVVYPWALSNVISGSPELLRPYVIGARTAAKYRNWHWEYVTRREGNGIIDLSDVNHYYPTKSEEISDKPRDDRGGNFGRFARTGLMDDYKEDIFKETLSGIPISAWLKFLKIFSEEQTEERIFRRLDRLASTEAPTQHQISNRVIEEIKNRLVEIVELARDEQ